MTLIVYSLPINLLPTRMIQVQDIQERIINGLYGEKLFIRLDSSRGQICYGIPELALWRVIECMKVIDRPNNKNKGYDSNDHGKANIFCEVLEFL